MSRSVLRWLATGLLVAIITVSAFPALAAGGIEQRPARSETSAVALAWNWLSRLLERWTGSEKAGPEIAPDGQPHSALACVPEVSCNYAGPEIAPDG